MPKKAEVQEEEVPAEEPQEEAPAEAPQEEVVPETPEPEEVTVQPKRKAASKAKAKPQAKRKNAPPATKTKGLDLKAKHECGQCGKVMSLHTALYGHKNCPGGVSVPQPPALTRQVVVEEAPPEPEPPQLSHAQLLRQHLAQAAQERRAQQHFRMVNPIRSFYGMG